MTEIAPVARSGGATSPHCGMVPRPAAPHPQPSGVLRDGTLCPPCATAPAGRKPGRGLSPQLQEVARLYRLGWTVDGMAARLGVSEKTIREYGYRVRQLGIELPRAPMRGGPPRRVSYGEVCRLANEGLRQFEIAARLGVSQKAVSRILIEMRAAGVSLPPGGRPKAGG